MCFCVALSYSVHAFLCFKEHEEKKQKLSLESSHVELTQVVYYDRKRQHLQLAKKLGLLQLRHSALPYMMYWSSLFPYIKLEFLSKPSCCKDFA